MVRFHIPIGLGGSWPIAAVTAIVAITFFALAARALRRTGNTSQTKWISGMRLVGTLLLISALANPGLIRHERRTAVIFAVDRSASMADQNKADSTLARMLSKMEKGSRVGVVEFGLDSRLTSPLASIDSLKLGAKANIDSDASDIARGLRTAFLSMPQGFARKVVLLSDGNQTLGSAELEAKRLGAAGAVIDCVPIDARSGQEVMVRTLGAPERVKENEPFDLRVVVDSTSKVTGTLSILRDGQPLAKRQLELKPGANAFLLSQRIDHPGPVTFEARLKASPDAMPGNNASKAVVSVEGAPRVMVMGETQQSSDMLIGTLRKQGISVEFATPSSAPKDLDSINAYDCVILNDLSAIHFPDSYLDLLRSYTEDLGGGLIAIGGPNSFGMGGYRNTPLEKALPVSMDVRERIKFPAMSLAIILDRSGSMGGESQGASKLDLAKEATMSVIDLLPDDAQVGVLTFDTQHEWSLPLKVHKDKDAVADRLSAVEPGGGTQMYQPMMEAYRALGASKAVIRHAIIITDGRSEPGDFLGVTKRMSEAGMTVSTVAIGSDADQPLLRGIAAGGKGRSYYTDDIYAIPRIFVTEAFMASKSMVVEETFTPKLKSRAPYLKGIGTAIPSLFGRVMTVAKPGAIVQLESPGGDPVLASWRIGLGRSAAFLSDATGKWSRGWVGWKDAPKLWAAVTRWTMRSWKESPLSVTPVITGGEMILTVDAVDSTGQYIDFMNLTARITGTLSGSGKAYAGSLPLVQQGPGRYGAELPLPGPGAFTILVADDSGNVAPATASVSLPYPEELRSAPPDRGLLTNIAISAGGRVVTPETFSPDSGLTDVPTRIPIWPMLLGLALVCLILDLAMRTIPEDIWSLGVSGSGPVKLLRGLRVYLKGDAAPQRYEDMIWKAKTGDQQRAVDRRYLGELSPFKSAGLYVARMKKVRQDQGDEGTDDGTGKGD